MSRTTGYTTHLFLISMLLLQYIVKAYSVDAPPTPQPLAKPHPRLIQLASLGDPIGFSFGLMLWLQQSDYQPGISLRYNQLDYARLIEWLRVIETLNPESHYPQALATRIWSQVPDKKRKRMMLAYIKTSFLQDPRRWRWLAEASLQAKHGLKDMALALDYAQTLAQHAPPDTPYWAKDMHLMLLEDLNELDSARLLIGGLLASGNIQDPYEIRFLEARLRQLESKQQATQHTKKNKTKDQ